MISHNYCQENDNDLVKIISNNHVIKKKDSMLNLGDSKIINQGQCHYTKKYIDEDL